MAESLEYRALLECFDSLVIALKSDPKSIADGLAAKSLISPREISYQRTNAEQARELADSILDRVKLAPDRYHDVVRILSRQQWMEDFVKILTTTYHDQNRAAHTEENSTRNHGGKDTSESPEFSCDLGNIPQYKSSFEVTNPIVRFSDLDDDDLEDLRAQINKLTKKINLEFGRFFDKVFASFRDSRKVDRDRLVLTLISEERLFKEDELAGTTSVYDIFKVIRHYCSYFNYDVLETLVQIHGSPQDKCGLEEYDQAFSVYCKAVPCVEEVCGSDHKDVKSKRTKLKFKLDFDRQQLKPDVVRSIKCKIADYLGIKPSALYLRRIEEGCMSLEFLVPMFILEDLFPLNSAQKNAFREDIEVLGIECEALNVNIQFEEKNLPKSKKGKQSRLATCSLSKSLPDLNTIPTKALGTSKEVSVSADNIPVLCHRRVDRYTTFESSVVMSVSSLSKLSNNDSGSFSENLSYSGSLYHLSQPIQVVGSISSLSDSNEFPGTPVHRKPIFKKDITKQMTTGDGTRPLLKEVSISDNNIPALCWSDCQSSSHLKKGYRTKKVMRRLDSTYQSGIELDDRNTSYHSDSMYYADSEDSAVVRIDLREFTSHRKTSFRTVAPPRHHSKAVGRTSTTSIDSNKPRCPTLLSWCSLM